MLRVDMPQGGGTNVFSSLLVKNRKRDTPRTPLGDGQLNLGPHGLFIHWRLPQPPGPKGRLTAICQKISHLRDRKRNQRYNGTFKIHRRILIISPRLPRAQRAATYREGCSRRLASAALPGSIDCWGRADQLKRKQTYTDLFEVPRDQRGAGLGHEPQEYSGDDGQQDRPKGKSEARSSRHEESRGRNEHGL
jgi:hypothetical protein